MSDRRSSGQRRHEKVLARRKRRGRRGAACGGSGRAADVAPESPTPDTDQPVAPPRLRESDGLDVLLESDEVVGVAALVDGALVAAIRRTLAEESAGPGDLVGARLRELGDEYAELFDDDEEHCRCCDLYRDPLDGPWWWALTRLGGWLRHAQDLRGGGPVLAREVVGWGVARLGRGGPTVDQQARLLGGPGAAVGELSALRECDLVAVLVWLVSGLVAVAGDRDVTFLRRLERAGRRE